MFKNILATISILQFLLFANAQAGVLKFGILPVIDTLPLQVAAKEGFFKDEKLNVELVPFHSAMERNIAAQSGHLDGFFGDMIATLLLIDKEVPVKILTISYYTNPQQRMFGLVTSPKFEPGSQVQLNVAISRASIIEYLLTYLQALPNAKRYSYKPVEIKQMPIRLQMLLAGKIDSALLPEPLVSLAESKGAVVLDTDQSLDMPLTILNLSIAKLDQADAFLKAYEKAVAVLNQSPDVYRDLMAETCRIPKPLVKNFPMYQYPRPRLPRKSEVNQVQDWMIKKGLLSARIPYETVVP